MNPTRPKDTESVEAQDRLDQTHFKLDSVRMDAFEKLLNQPVSKASNPGLDRLLAITAPWVDKKR
ncbi:MAG: hypothetical protein RL676_1271 [Pseudomonadota bacterium]|jgi:uncharacterized protein (DUF1778 family)